MAEKKTCTHCRKKKAPEDFYAHPRTIDRLQSWCRKCMTEAAGRRNKERKAEKVKG